MTRTATVILGLLLCLCVGCTRHLTNDHVVGRYYASGEWGKSTLVLNPDGTFVQNVFPANGNEKSTNGKWRMRDDDTRGYTKTIDFEPFISLLAQQLGESVPYAGCTVESVGFRGVWIDVDLGRGTMYKKQ